MAYDDVITRNESEELAVRVVSATEGSNSSTYDDVFTRDTNGKLAVRVVGAGGGGSDVHNLGWYATQSALEEAHPTAESGDYAIVGSTDSVWVWDEDTTAWVNTAVAGTVTSVNNQTGAVTITLSDLGGQAELVSGTNIKTINGNSVLGSGNLELSTYLTYPAGWTTNSTTKAFCDSIAADTTAVAGKAYLGEVTCSDLPAGVLNAEIVVEIMDGTTAQDKVIVLSLKSGNVAPYAWQYVYWDNGTNVSGWKTWQEPLVSGTNIKTVNNTSLLGSGNITIDSLPSQTGNAGKFLTTDGTDASWGDSVSSEINAVYDLSSANSYLMKFRCSSDQGSVYFYQGTTPKVGINFYPTFISVGGCFNVEANAIYPIGFTDTLGKSSDKWETAYIKKLNNGANITVPAVAGEMAVKQVNTTITLTSAGWSSNTQTVNVTGMTATGVVLVSPDPTDQADYTSAGIYCSAQSAGSLEFTCTNTPTSDIDVVVVML